MTKQLLSTFELLLNTPQLPASLLEEAPQLSAISRELIQGYFLTLSNTTSSDIKLGIDFAVKTTEGETIFKPGDPRNPANTVALFYDVAGRNETFGIDSTSLSLEPASSDFETRLIVTIKAFETALLIVQPNPSALLAEEISEIRGFVSVFLKDPAVLPSANFLFSAEQRATFYKLEAIPTGEASQILPDQIAYSVPISSTNGSLLEVLPL